MLLDRNINTNGKYALINLRKINEDPLKPQGLIELLAANPQSIEFGAVGAPDEFWVIKLKDKYALAALRAYADAAEADDPEYAAEVRSLADRSGCHSPFCKTPD